MLTQVRNDTQATDREMTSLRSFVDALSEGDLDLIVESLDQDPVLLFQMTFMTQQSAA